MHVTLAKMLATWRLAGFSALMGRAPKDDDLVIPSSTGRNRNSNYSLRCFHEDLERIGIRARRQHDLRRTFITLARSDGARKDVLQRISGEGGIRNRADDRWAVPTDDGSHEDLRDSIEAGDGSSQGMPPGCSSVVSEPPRSPVLEHVDRQFDEARRLWLERGDRRELLALLHTIVALLEEP